MSLTDRNHEDYWTEYFGTLESEIEHQNKLYKEEEVSAIDIAIKFAQYRTKLAILDEKLKQWQIDNLESILNEADKYGDEGYRGYKFSSTARPMYNYSTNPEWNRLKDQREKIEQQMKAAYLNTGKNLANVTFDGEEITLPEVTYTKPSLKAEIIKRR